MKQIAKLVIMAGVLVLFGAHVGFAAYNHSGDTDSVNFRSAYPDKVGTKLDSCTLCHKGTKTMASCQWCHKTYGYDASGNIDDTLNLYGIAYRSAGRDQAALVTIEADDSDVDGYSNKVEIAAIRYPGDPDDTPAKVPAAYRIYTRDQLDQMPQHTQFLLMNVTKSSGGDSYVQYSGVVMEELLNRAGMLSSATDIIVYSPDGFYYSHPLLPPVSQDPLHLQYFVIGPYPKGTFYYSAEADMSLTGYGWCDYSAPSCEGRIKSEDGVPIPDDLKMLLGIKRDGVYLTPGVLDSSNKLNGEGPFRVVPPQVIPGHPDQSSKSSHQDVIWPYNEYNDHNAGASTRSTTIVKVDPLPPGTTDINVLEAGWNYIDDNKIVVYGAIDPVPTILEKLDELVSAIGEAGKGKFKNPSSQRVLIQKVEVVMKQVTNGAYSGTLEKLQNDILQKTDGCIVTGTIDKNDWVTDCDIQKQLYWAINEIVVLLNIIL